MSRPRLLKNISFYGYLGFLVLVVASVFTLREKEPFFTWYYCFSWWSLILMLDAAVFAVKGTSLMKENFVQFLALIPLSCGIWLIFEAYNLRLGNWSYWGIPRLTWERHLGYFLGFGTVLPAIFEVRDLLEAGGLFQRRIFAVLELGKRTISMAGWFGLLACVLPIVWPEFFFPLVWIGFIFLLEALLYPVSNRSLLRQAEHAGGKEIYLLLVAGCICGGLWEWWNMWSGAKWIYDIPFVGFLKVGEMPVLGFLGFPFFAVECYLLTHACQWVWKRANLLVKIFLSGALFYWIFWMFRMIDTHTVWLFT